MKNRVLLLAGMMAMMFLLVGCSKDEIMAEGPDETLVVPSDTIEEEKVFLTLDVQLEPIEQARRSGVCEEFIKGDMIGIFADGVSNRQYTYNGESWITSEAITVDEEKKVYAYFPFHTGNTSASKINVNISRQEDLLYGSAVVTGNLPTASIKMNHALALLRFKVLKDTYQGEGIVDGMTLRNVVARGTMDGLGRISPMSARIDLPLGETYRLDDLNPRTMDAILIPESSAGMTAEFIIDGKTLKYEIPSTHVWEAGKMYTYTLRLKGDYNVSVDLENVPIDVEYWSQYGKTDEIRLADCGDDQFIISPYYTYYGSEVYQNEGMVFGVMYTSYNFVSDFDGKVRFVFMKDGKIVEKFQPVDLRLEAGSWGSTRIQCYVTSEPGTYQLVPIFQRNGQSTWFRGVGYDDNGGDEEWMYTVNAPAPDDLPALRLMEVEGESFTPNTIYPVPDEGEWPLYFTLSNKAEVALKGTVKAVWEREFKLGCNSYRPSQRKNNTTNDEEYRDELGTMDIDISAGVRNWKGMLRCHFPVKRKDAITSYGAGYASPVLHLYWKAYNSDDWVLLRTDSDYLFNLDYDGQKSIFCYAANYIFVMPKSWEG